mmetsp:Transcript_38830/g.64428  ORF Transcript_38830/g.64428 Transcript_38830/m.64428 type:complete len:731 (+) Transcript_38830:47-2239(+)
MAAKNTFSKVDIDKMDLSEYGDLDDEKKPESGGMGGMGGMMGGMGGMGMDGDMGDMMNNLPGGMGGSDFDDWKVSSMEPGDVGKKMDCTGGKKTVMKRLIEAGKGYDNPRTGFEVDIKYCGMLPDGTKFDSEYSEEPRRVLLGSGLLIEGLERAIKTFKVGEHCSVKIQPEMAFGEEGDEAQGVPADTAVSYDLTLLEMYEIKPLADGKLTKKTIRRADSQDWEKPRKHAEVKVQWSAELLPNDGTDGKQLFEERLYEFAMDDPAVPPFWKEIDMKKGEIAEVSVLEPEMAFGEAGDGALGVPPNAQIKAKITMQEWLDWEDISKPHPDGTLFKATTTKGSGWEKPKPNYECTISLKVTAASGVMFDKDDLLLVLDSAAGPQSEEIDSACGGAKVCDALHCTMKSLTLGEEALLRVTPPLANETDTPLRMQLAMKSWTKVEPVPHTEEQVIRKVLFDPPDVYMRPNEEATCKIKYKVCVAGEEEPVEAEDEKVFIQSEGAVLRCIDAAVREMKTGERSLLTAPAAWAYGAPQYLAPTNKERLKDCTVEVEIELLSFERALDSHEMNPYQKIAAQNKKKEQGNAQFKSQQYEAAVKLYKKSNGFFMSEHDLSKMEDKTEEEREVEHAAAKKVKVASYVNMAVCQLRLSAVTDAVESCNSALEIDPQSVKALYRRGQARIKQNDFSEARTDLMAAARLDPKNKEIRQSLEDLKQIVAKSAVTARAMYGGMFK